MDIGIRPGRFKAEKSSKGLHGLFRWIGVWAIDKSIPYPVNG